MPCPCKSACISCADLNTCREVACLQERAAGTPVAGTNYHYYSFDQLCSLLKKKNKQINDWKLQVRFLFSFAKIYKAKDVTVSQSHEAGCCAYGHVSNHKQFMAVLAFNDVPALIRLIKVALQAGKGPKEIIHHIKLAWEGLYSVKSYMVRKRSPVEMSYMN
jgi:hypothetical protein